MKTFKQLFEDALNEKGKIIVLDTESGMDSEKIVDVLKKDKIKFTKVGPLISLEMDRKSAPAAVLISHLHKIAKFDELREGAALDRFKAHKAKGDKSSFECMECGAKFKKKIGKGEVKCPKCKSTDVEVD